MLRCLIITELGRLRQIYRVSLSLCLNSKTTQVASEQSARLKVRDQAQQEGSSREGRFKVKTKVVDSCNYQKIIDRLYPA